MRFADSSWLWGILLIPVLYGLFVFLQHQRKIGLGKFANPAVWGAIAPEMDPRLRHRKAWVWLAAFGLILIALARPQFGKKEEVLKVTGLDLIIALDVSNSMLVEDVVPSRLKKARHLIRSIIDGLGGDRVGIVAFAASSYLASPLTTDLDYILEVIDTLDPASVVNQGTDIGIALETATGALERGAEDLSRDQSSDSPPTKVVVLISDGEDLQAKAFEGVKTLIKAGNQLFVMGVGTEKGGPVPVRDDRGVLRGYKKDSRGETVISKFRSGGLQKLAAAADGRFWKVSAAEGEVDEFLEAVGALDRSGYAERRVTVYQEHYQIPLVLAVLLLLLELSLPVRRMVATGALLLTFLPSQSIAAPAVGTYLDNKEGLNAFGDGELEKAKKHFGAAQARDPRLAELMFNRGVVEAQMGDAESAMDTLDRAAQGAKEQGNGALEARSRYNLGAVFEQQGKTKDAIASYLQGIQAAKETGDEKIELDLRKKIELLSQQQQQQKKQKKKEGDEEKKKEDQKSDQEEQDQQKSEKDDNQEKENKSPQYADQEKKNKPFESQKLSKEDAERVMSELANREKELQRKLRKQKGSRVRQQQDW